MRFTDRVLLATVVLSGVLLAQGPLRGDNEGCTTECQMTGQYYDCVKKHAYEYYIDDCFQCVNGMCFKRSNMPGGGCVKTDWPRKFRYVQNYTKKCDCNDDVTRIEVWSGEPFTEWDQIDTDMVYTCQQAGTGSEPGGGFGGGWGFP